MTLRLPNPIEFPLNIFCHSDLRKAKAKPPKKRGDDEDEYDDDFDDDGAPDPQKPTLQTIPTPNFEDMDLAELSTALLACMTAVANVSASRACASLLWPSH